MTSSRSVQRFVFDDDAPVHTATEDELVAALKAFAGLSEADIMRRRLRVFAELNRNRRWSMTDIARQAGVTRQAVANQLATLDAEDRIS